jgi:hypothetical protein
MKVLSTLLEAGFTPADLGGSNVDLIADCLELALGRGGGVVGFSMPLTHFPMTALTLATSLWCHA